MEKEASERPTIYEALFKGAEIEKDAGALGALPGVPGWYVWVNTNELDHPFIHVHLHTKGKQHSKKPKENKVFYVTKDSRNEALYEEEPAMARAARNFCDDPVNLAKIKGLYNGGHGV